MKLRLKYVEMEYFFVSRNNHSTNISHDVIVEEQCVVSLQKRHKLFRDVKEIGVPICCSLDVTPSRHAGPNFDF